MNITPIGFIESCYKQKFGTPRQSGLVDGARGFIRIDSTYQPEISLEGLKDFTHLWVIFVFHELKNYSFHGKVHPPRLNGDSVGLFATRSPHRPNPIGLSLVRLGEVHSNGIEIWGGDFVDGTPVLDIKPYLKEIESVPTAKSGWAEGKSHFLSNISFTYSEESQGVLDNLDLPFEVNGDPHKHFKKVLEDTLLLDPRPEVYKGLDKEHVIRLWNWDVFFTMENSEIKINRIVTLRS